MSLISTTILGIDTGLSSKQLSFDVDSFRKIKNEALTTISTIESTRDNLNDSVSALRDGWKTPAGDYFFSKVDVDWNEDIARYIAALRCFCDVLDDLIETYTLVEEAAAELVLQSHGGGRF